MTKTTRQKYLELFPEKVRHAALEQALDIRKFEIELYWKRATYFWTFIGATFAGYFALRNSSNSSFESTYILTCLGLVFSVAWYFVNRGSKAWQRNWEAQVDLLEDEFIGPLYKSGLNRYRFSFWDITAGYPFSPSGINQMLSLFVVAVWFFLAARTLVGGNLCGNSENANVALAMSLITIVAIALLATKGRTDISDETINIDHRMRKYHDEA